MKWVYIVTWTILQLQLIGIRPPANDYGLTSTMALMNLRYQHQRITMRKTFDTREEVLTFVRDMRRPANFPTLDRIDLRSVSWDSLEAPIDSTGIK